MSQTNKNSAMREIIENYYSPILVPSPMTGTEFSEYKPVDRLGIQINRTGKLIQIVYYKGKLSTITAYAQLAFTYHNN